ncbi:protein ABSCISIC ACID-INSENSITIVE 5-like [Hibiscus syriacus]|uniref:protein ABSCISIC ACID-INSENSITIVE 5-like n=1 Tax=Hibiscus syriacus TaxID=106335 RepID=UPI001920FF86|nr:protein ABSCISIC ACID-INSENSITIVE 5-like [Hibiscus syriacus]
MGDNSLDWANILAGSPDSDEITSLLINDFKSKNPEDEQLQDSSKFLLQRATMELYQQNNHGVMRDVETGSSSFLNDQNNMMSIGVCLVNPLGFPYRPQMQVLPAHAPSGSGLQWSGLLFNIKGRNRMQEAIGEAQQRKKMNKIRNRISAAKSRAKTQERTRFLEEKVEHLRNENAHLKKLLSPERKGIEEKRQSSV